MSPIIASGSLALPPDQVIDETARFLGHGDGGLASEVTIAATIPGTGQNAVEAQPLGDKFVQA